MSRAMQMPAPDKLLPLLAHMSGAMADAGTFVDKHNRTKQLNQIKVCKPLAGLCCVACRLLTWACCQGVQAGLDVLAWVTMAPKPAPYIKETIGSAQFYTNRVLKDFKDSEPKQADWAKAYVALLNGLHDYVKVRE